MNEHIKKHGMKYIIGGLTLILAGTIAVGHNVSSRCNTMRQNGVRYVRVPVFPMGRVLTTSARDYVESIGRKIDDYVMIGVHGTDMMGGIPNRTEVVVDYKFIGLNGNGRSLHCAGTALVPKVPLFDNKIDKSKGIR